MGGKQVAGDVLLHELVVREVLVESADHVVAIAPGVLLVEVEFVAVGFGEAHQIEPVPGPALAIVRRDQQPVDDLFISLRGIVGKERRDLFGRGRQAGEVEGDAAQQGGLVRGRRRSDALCFQLGEEERVDR